MWALAARPLDHVRPTPTACVSASVPARARLRPRGGPARSRAFCVRDRRTRRNSRRGRAPPGQPDSRPKLYSGPRTRRRRYRRLLLLHLRRLWPLSIRVGRPPKHTEAARGRRARPNPGSPVVVPQRRADRCCPPKELGGAVLRRAAGLRRAAARRTLSEGSRSPGAPQTRPEAGAALRRNWGAPPRRGNNIFGGAPGRCLDRRRRRGRARDGSLGRTGLRRPPATGQLGRGLTLRALYWPRQSEGSAEGRCP